MSADIQKAKAKQQQQKHKKNSNNKTDNVIAEFAALNVRFVYNSFFPLHFKWLVLVSII